MKLIRPKRPEYNQIRNKLIIWLKKVEKWNYSEIAYCLENEYGNKITRQRVRDIYLAHQKDYSIKEFRGYMAPESLARV